MTKALQKNLKTQEKIKVCIFKSSNLYGKIYKLWTFTEMKRCFMSGKKVHGLNEYKH